jgi:hypothetical protein
MVFDIERAMPMKSISSLLSMHWVRSKCIKLGCLVMIAPILTQNS